MAYLWLYQSKGGNDITLVVYLVKYVFLETKGNLDTSQRGQNLMQNKIISIFLTNGIISDVLNMWHKNRLACVLHFTVTLNIFVLAKKNMVLAGTPSFFIHLPKF